jgi:hypothetical protein
MAAGSEELELFLLSDTHLLLKFFFMNLIQISQPPTFEWPGEPNAESKTFPH